MTHVDLNWDRAALRSRPGDPACVVDPPTFSSDYGLSVAEQEVTEKLTIRNPRGLGMLTRTSKKVEPNFSSTFPAVTVSF